MSIPPPETPREPEAVSELLTRALEGDELPLTHAVEHFDDAGRELNDLLWKLSRQASPDANDTHAALAELRESFSQLVYVAIGTYREDAEALQALAALYTSDSEWRYDLLSHLSLPSMYVKPDLAQVRESLQELHEMYGLGKEFAAKLTDIYNSRLVTEVCALLNYRRVVSLMGRQAITEPLPDSNKTTDTE